MYRFLISVIMLLSIAGCSTFPMNAEVVSDQGAALGSADMQAFEQRGFKIYSVKAVLPDETLFRGEMKFGEKSVTLFSDNGVSMDCSFDMNDPAKRFAAGGKGVCTTSDGQKLKVKF